MKVHYYDRGRSTHCRCGNKRDLPHRPLCKVCREAGRKRRKYGLSQEDLLVLSEKQKNRCACCKRKVKRLVVDHDHDTGKVRGLLCYRCNMGLGYYEKYKDLYRRYLGRLEE